MFKWAADEGRIDNSPIAKLSVPRGEARDYVVNECTHETILEGASDGTNRRKPQTVTAFKAYLILMRLTGCRPGEPTRVKIEDFDGETWTI